MRLTSVAISNIKAIDFIEFEVGTVTLLRGANGVGKSSIIDAITAVFEGGHDPRLLRQGRKVGGITLTLDNGDTITVKITEKETTRKVTTADGGVIPAPATYIKSLAKSFKFNPVALVTMKPKERLKALLDVVPITFEAAEVERAVDAVTGSLGSAPLSLDRLNQLRQGRYDARADANRALKNDEGAVAELERSLPKGDAQEYTELVSTLRAQVEDGRAELERRKAELKAAAEEKRNAATLQFHKAMRELQAEFDMRRTAIQQTCDADTAEVLADANARQQVIEAEHAATYGELRSALATAEAAVQEQARAVGIRRQLELVRERMQKNSGEVDRLDKAIKALDAMKAKRLAESSLGIPGVEPREDDVYVNGVPWEHVNKSMQCRVAIAIGSLGLGDLPLMVLDEAEVLDGDTLKALTEAIKEGNLQAILARVETGTTLTAEGI